MADLIHQIIDIVKNIVHMFDTTLLAPLTEIGKSVGMLLVKVLELAIMGVKWVVAKM